MAAAIGRPDAYSGELPVVYVELEKDSECTQDELLTFAQEKIAEKAAWPKEIIFITAMPVTPVGKIFKPALQMREIENVVRLEAKAHSAEIISLEVSQHAQRGLLAQIKVEKQTVDFTNAIGKYAFESELL